MQYILKTFNGFTALPMSYKELFESIESSTFDQSLPWFEELSNILTGHYAKLCIYGMESVESGDLAVVIPLIISARGFPPFRYRQASALSNYYTANFSPLFSQKFNMRSEEHTSELQSH